jgi:hypothetical protein
MNKKNVQPNVRKKMKKVIMILMTAAAMTAMSCGDGNNTARERENDAMDNTETAEPDTTSMESDTTSTQDMNQRDNGRTQNESSQGTESQSRNQRDTLQ